MALEMSEYTVTNSMSLSEIIGTFVSLYTEAMLKQNTEEDIRKKYNEWIGNNTKAVH